MVDYKISLPKAKVSTNLLVQSLNKRRSVRKYAEKNLTTAEISQLLWAAGGKSEHKRTVPSAGALYPLEIYLIWEYELFRYLPNDHGLELVKKLNARDRWRLCKYSAKQDAVFRAPVLIILAADYAKTIGKYAKRGTRYVHIEVGHAGQNIALQATALGLGSVMIGAFSEKRVKLVLGIDEDPLYVIPIGRI